MLRRIGGFLILIISGVSFNTGMSALILQWQVNFEVERMIPIFFYFVIGMLLLLLGSYMLNYKRLKRYSGIVIIYVAVFVLYTVRNYFFLDSEDIRYAERILSIIIQSFVGLALLASGVVLIFMQKDEDDKAKVIE